VRFWPGNRPNLDADVELNAYDFKLQHRRPGDDYDLDSVLTHELGHWLGLAHTLDSSATMFAEYKEGSDSLAASPTTTRPASATSIRRVDRLRPKAASPAAASSDACLADSPLRPSH